jgi:hypothetical protein
LWLSVLPYGITTKVTEPPPISAAIKSGTVGGFGAPICYPPLDLGLLRVQGSSPAEKV